MPPRIYRICITSLLIIFVNLHFFLIYLDWSYNMTNIKDATTSSCFYFKPSHFFEYGVGIIGVIMILVNFLIYKPSASKKDTFFT